MRILCQIHKKNMLIPHLPVDYIYICSATSNYIFLNKKAMNKSLLLMFWVLLAAPSLLFAQQKSLTIEDAILAYYKGLYPKNIDPVWLPDSKSFSYFDKQKQALFLENVQQKSAKEILNLQELNRALAEKGLKPIYYLYGYEWISATVFEMINGTDFFAFNVKTKNVTQMVKLPKEAENILKSPTGAFAYTKDNNLYIWEKGKETAISNEENKDIEFGHTVHRNEFGINGGIFWSPSGKKLAYYRNDQTEVTDYPLVDVSRRIAELKNEKYPMAGMTNEQVSLWIYDLETKTSKKINTGKEKDQFLTNVAWGSEELSVYIAVLNRGQNHMKLNQYKLADGNYHKTLFEQKHSTWVEPEHPMQFLKKSPNQFLWQSEKDGYNHVYLYNTDGKEIKQLTKGKWIVTDVLGTDAKEKTLYVLTTIKSPLERHLCAVNLKNGKLKVLTSEAGTHSVKLSPDKKVFIDSYSAVQTPRVINIVNIKGKKVRNVLTAENPLKEHKVGEVEMFSIKAADNSTELHGRIVKPVDFQKGKKYPMIVYVYGGPHAQMVQNRWLGAVRYWQLYMAQKGYVCMTVDNRGSGNRGFEFENVIHRNLGKAEMADQMKAVEYMLEQGYVDEKRIGVHGWSYGGFMTTSLMTNYPDVFKVGVAGGPVVDWKYYEIMYGERYMDTPEENPEGYKSCGLLPMAKNLKGKLLMIHGAIDPVVVWQHSMAFVRECVKANKQLDYFVYPSHEHNVRGRDRVHLMDKVSIYFDDFLK